MDKMQLWEKIKKAYNQKDELYIFTKTTNFSQFFCKINNTNFFLFKISLSSFYVRDYDLSGYYRGIYYAVNRKIFNIQDIEFFNLFNPINYKKRIHDIIDWIIDYYEFKNMQSKGLNILVINQKKYFKKLYEKTKNNPKLKI